MKKKRINMLDIANEANVSLSTVSRVLNKRCGSIRISEKTQKMVLDTARKLGYKHNPIAAALKTQRTGILGAVIRDIGDPFLLLIFRNIQRAAHARGLEVFLAHAEYDLSIAQHQIQVMDSNWFDGVFLIGNLPGYKNLINNLKLEKKPMVAVACGATDYMPSVNTDNYGGGMLALNYLNSLGHKKIAFIGNGRHIVVQERLSAYRDFLSENDIHPKEEYLQLKCATRKDALEATIKILKLDEKPTAIFCASDLLALGTLHGVLQAFKKVPDNISIIGFDDIEESLDAFVPLTTIRQPVDEMSEMAIDLMRDAIENVHGADVAKKIANPVLIVRDSCASVPH